MDLDDGSEKEVEEFAKLCSFAVNFLPDDRNTGLSHIERWHKYETVFYRQNVYSHKEILKLLVRELNPIARRVFGMDFDTDYALALAEIHDDPEMLTGDIPQTYKDAMSIEEKISLDHKELAACYALAERYGGLSIKGFDYLSLSIAYIKMEDIEAHFVNLLDKIASVWESFLEVRAGNKGFDGSGASPPEPYPTINCLKKVEKIASNFNLHDFFSYGHPALEVPFHLTEADIKTTIERGRPHTRRSIREPTEIRSYDTWRQIVIAGGYETILITQKEGR